MDAAGDSCAWCGKEASHRALVTPPQKTNSLRDRYTVPVCGEHALHFAAQGVEIQAFFQPYVEPTLL